MISTRLWGKIERNTVPGDFAFSFNKSCTLHTHLNDTIYFHAFRAGCFTVIGSSLAAYSNMERISFIIHHKHINQRHHKCPLANFLASTYIFNCQQLLLEKDGNVLNISACSGIKYQTVDIINIMYFVASFYRMV